VTSLAGLHDVDGAMLLNALGLADLFFEMNAVLKLLVVGTVADGIASLMFLFGYVVLAPATGFTQVRAWPNSIVDVESAPTRRECLYKSYSDMDAIETTSLRHGIYEHPQVQEEVGSIIRAVWSGTSPHLMTEEELEARNVPQLGRRLSCLRRWCMNPQSRSVLGDRRSAGLVDARGSRSRREVEGSSEVQDEISRRQLAGVRASTGATESVGRVDSPRGGMTHVEVRTVYGAQIQSRLTPRTDTHVIIRRAGHAAKRSSLAWRVGVQAPVARCAARGPRLRCGRWVL
jgi:hypothetical protein